MADPSGTPPPPETAGTGAAGGSEAATTTAGDVATTGGDGGDGPAMLAFGKIALVGKHVQNGQLKIAGEGIGWTHPGSGKTVTVQASEIEGLKWIRVRGEGRGSSSSGASGKSYLLKVVLKTGLRTSLQGFHATDRDRINELTSAAWGVSIEDEELNWKGVNWGEVAADGRALAFTNDGLPIFEVPFAEISQSFKQGRNEISLTFDVDDTERNDEHLVDMRIYIPTPVEGDHDAMTVDKMHELVMEEAGIRDVAGTSILKVPHLALLTPRGRYDLELFPKFMNLHGKSYNYKISYDSILRLFLLPHPDMRRIMFVVSLDPPVRSGSKGYPHVLIQFDQTDTMDVTLNLSDEQMAAYAEANHSVEREMSGESYKILSRLIRAFSGKKITIPGAFRSVNDHAAIRASYKANAGLIFPLNKSFFFTHKPPTHIRFSDVNSIEFGRVSTITGTSRTFDLIINTSTTSYTYTNINRNEYDNLVDYIQRAEIKILNIKGAQAAFGKGAGKVSYAEDPYMNAILDDVDYSESADDADWKPEQASVSSDPDSYEFCSGDAEADGKKKKKKKKKKDKKKDKKKAKKSKAKNKDKDKDKDKGKKKDKKKDKKKSKSKSKKRSHEDDEGDDDDEPAAKKVKAESQDDGDDDDDGDDGDGSE